MASAKVRIWNFGKCGIWGLFGIGHGSLEIVTNGGYKYYITWLGGSENMFAKSPVDPSLGFQRMVLSKHTIGRLTDEQKNEVDGNYVIKSPFRLPSRGGLSDCH